MIGDQILDTFLSSFCKEHDLNDSAENNFEHFANYAVLSRLYSGSVDLDELETGAAFGIDGIAIIANSMLVTTEAEIEGIAKHDLEAKFVFVQAKTSSKFDTGDILKFTQAVDDFFDKNPRLPANERIDHFRRLKNKIYEQSLKMEEPPNCELYYVSTGVWREDSTITGLMHSEKQRLREKYGFGELKIVFVDLEKLKSYYRSIKNRVVRKIEFDRRIAIPKVAGADQAFIGILSALQYLTLITDADGNLERGLFYENVRDYLGENPVNADIATAIRDSAALQDRFVLLNNGVTIVARSILPSAYDFTIRDYQVVNGCQTSHVLYSNRSYVTSQLWLPVKLIVTESSELANLVTKATNWQTEVKKEAFIALEPFQKRLEEFFNSIPSPEKRLYYERRSKQYEADDTPKLRVITLTLQTKCFVAMYLKGPQSVHRYYGELLKAYSRDIFREEHDPEPYYLAAYSMFKIEQALRANNKAISPLRQFKFHLLYLLRLRIFGAAQIQLVRGSKQMKQFCQRLNSLLDDQQEFEAFLTIASKVLSDEVSRSGFKYRGEAERRSDFTAAIGAAFLERSKPLVSTQSTDQSESIATVKASEGLVKGIVKWLGPDYGFIVDSQQRDVFFHRSKWIGPQVLHRGLTVAFELRDGARGYYASKVQPDDA